MGAWLIKQRDISTPTPQYTVATSSCRLAIRSNKQNSVQQFKVSANPGRVRTPGHCCSAVISSYLRCVEIGALQARTRYYIPSLIAIVMDQVFGHDPPGLSMIIEISDPSFHFRFNISNGV